MRINGTKRALQSLIAVGFWMKDLGHLVIISCATQYSFGKIFFFSPVKIDRNVKIEVEINQIQIFIQCIHMFSDITIEKNENIYILRICLIILQIRKIEN